MAAAKLVATATDRLQEVLPESLKQHSKVLVLTAGGVVAVSVVRYIGKTWYRTNPFAFGRTGALAKDKIDDSINGYNSFFSQKDGKGIEINKKMSTPEFVDKFYSLITDFYEYGWGHSFHFAPRMRGESFDASIKRYEVNIGKAIGLKPGMKAIDLGCGVGGPMRTIAKSSGAHVTGITINEYQVKRCTHHNQNAGLSEQCSVVQGNFLELPFPENTFDGAYCIEAACHAPRLELLYKQAFKVLKPGAKFASYEWLRTDKYDPKNPEHVRLVDGVAEGNALPDVRCLDDVKAAAKEAGFIFVSADDVALTAEIPWQHAMWTAQMGSYITHVMTVFLETVGWAPKGTAAVHKMLINAASDLVRTGDLGIFTPMYLCVMQKPGKAK